MIGAVALASRGLHLDGLADTADGLAASYDRDRALETMRRGNTGPAGVVAIVLVLLIQTASAAAVLGRAWGAVGGWCAGLPGQVFVAHRLRRGVTGGAAGLGAAVAGVVPRAVTAAGVLAAAAICALLLMATGSPWWLGGSAILAASLVVIGLLVRTRQRFGGVTGDVLGAGIELFLGTLLVIASVS